MPNEFRATRGSRPRRFLLSISLASTLILSFALVSVISLSRVSPPPHRIDIPGALQPGQPAPGDPPCTARHNDYRGGMATCTDGTHRSQRYFVEYDPRRRVIIHASLWTAQEDLSLGDLMLAWGQPTGIDNSFVMWGTRGAFAADAQSLAPDNKVYFISYDLEQGQQDQWRGFINTRPYSFSLKLPDLTALLRSNP